MLSYVVTDKIYDDLKDKGYMPANVTCDKELLKWESVSRRPVYKLRGKPLEKHQAWDIIRRIDIFEHREHEGNRSADEIQCFNFATWWFANGESGWWWGWVHPDGRLSFNGLTQKYPNMIEFIADWSVLAHTFPYLDLMIGIFDVEEVFPENVTEYEVFQIGIHVKNGHVVMLNKTEGWKLYQEYNSLYSENVFKHVTKDDGYPFNQEYFDWIKVRYEEMQKSIIPQEPCLYCENFTECDDDIYEDCCCCDNLWYLYEILPPQV